MAETLEYPPAFVEYRPLQYKRHGNFPSGLRLCHHFLLTRFKIALKAVFGDGHVRRETDQAGLQHEITNVLISQGITSALGIPVPTPFFFHAFLFGPNTNSHNDKINNGHLARIMMSIDISERDLAFYEDVMEGYTDWWTAPGVRYPTFEELTDILFGKVSKLMDDGLISPILWHPISSKNIDQILNVWLRKPSTAPIDNSAKTSKRQGSPQTMASKGPADTPQPVPPSGSGPTDVRRTAQGLSDLAEPAPAHPSLLASAVSPRIGADPPPVVGVQAKMSPAGSCLLADDPMETQGTPAFGSQSPAPIPKPSASVPAKGDNGDEVDFSPPDLSDILVFDEDSVDSAKHIPEKYRVDFALYEELTRTQTQVHQLMGLEQELLESAKWNYDTSLQLIRLATLRDEIPFGTRSELFDLKPTALDPPFSRKGKEREHIKPKKRAIYHILPSDANKDNTAEPDDPIPPMPQPPEARKFDLLLPTLFPHWFGEDATHHCMYRQQLFEFVAYDLQHRTTKELAELNKLHESQRFKFWPRVPAIPIVTPTQSIPTPSSNMNPNLFEHIAANSMPTVRFVTPESLPPSPSPEHPNSDSGSGSWDTDSGSDGDTDSGQVVLDYVDNNATFSTCNNL